MGKSNNTQEKEQQIIDLINQCRANNRRSPTLDEIAKVLEMSHQGAAHYVNRMITEGVLSRIVVNGYSVPRSLRVVETTHDPD